MKKYNLLIPIGGKSKRFTDADYVMPKPLIMAKNKPIIDWSMQSIYTKDCNIIFVVRRDNINSFSIDIILREKFGNDIQIIEIEHDTDGTLSTCLIASEYIDNNIPLIIYTPDVYFENIFDPNDIPADCDGFLLSFKANSSDHSYIKLDENKCVIQTAEKSVISENAAVGFYYFKRGSDFIKFGKQTINKNEKINNEFYICPIYNYLIADGQKIKIKEVEKMHVLGTPEELEFFAHRVCCLFGDRPIALCCDHSGFKTKEEAKIILNKHNIPFIDYGTFVYKDADYNDFVIQAGNSIQEKICDFALGFCRTGQGINIAANSISGVLSALVFDEHTAEMSRRHNCCNFFSIPEKYVTSEMLEKIILKLKNSTFDGGRHLTRVRKSLSLRKSNASHKSY